MCTVCYSGALRLVLRTQPRSQRVPRQGEDARCPEPGKATDWMVWLDRVVEAEGVSKCLTVRHLVLGKFCDKA